MSDENNTGTTSQKLRIERKTQPSPSSSIEKPISTPTVETSNQESTQSGTTSQKLRIERKTQPSPSSSIEKPTSTQTAETSNQKPTSTQTAATSNQESTPPKKKSDFDIEYKKFSDQITKSNSLLDFYNSVIKDLDINEYGNNAKNISIKIKDKLNELYRNEKTKYIMINDDLNTLNVFKDIDIGKIIINKQYLHLGKSLKKEKYILGNLNIKVIIGENFNNIEKNKKVLTEVSADFINNMAVKVAYQILNAF